MNAQVQNRTMPPCLGVQEEERIKPHVHLLGSNVTDAFLLRREVKSSFIASMVGESSVEHNP